MSDQGSSTRRSNFKRFFLRGLALVLPTLLTLWIVIWAFGFVQNYLALPINNALRETALWAVPNLTPFPRADDQEVQAFINTMDPLEKVAWEKAGSNVEAARMALRRSRLNKWWNETNIPLNLLGLAIAVVAIYMAGALVGSLLVRRIKHKGEGYIERVPLVGKLYQATKQVTEFLFGSDRKMQYSRVVAVEYPRKGMWSVGLVTGKTLPAVELQAGKPCVTVFMPASPTPFTGWVIVVPVEETVDLPITTEDAIRFFISGGVIVPEKRPDGSIKPMMLPPADGLHAPNPTTG